MWDNLIDDKFDRINRNLTYLKSTYQEIYGNDTTAAPEIIIKMDSIKRNVNKLSELADTKSNFLYFYIIQNYKHEHYHKSQDKQLEAAKATLWQNPIFSELTNKGKEINFFNINAELIKRLNNQQSALNRLCIQIKNKR